MRSIPSSVFGPVLRPPCILHLPFRIAGAWQGDRLRVLAKQRGERVKSPGGLLFFSHPRRFAWGVPSLFEVIPRYPRIPQRSLVLQGIRGRAPQLPFAARLCL